MCSTLLCRCHGRAQSPVVPKVICKSHAKLLGYTCPESGSTTLQKLKQRKTSKQCLDRFVVSSEASNTSAARASTRNDVSEGVSKPSK